MIDNITGIVLGTVMKPSLIFLCHNSATKLISGHNRARNSLVFLTNLLTLLITISNLAMQCTGGGVEPSALQQFRACRRLKLRCPVRKPPRDIMNRRCTAN